MWKIEKRIILVDGEQLAELMIAHRVGLATSYHTPSRE